MPDMLADPSYAHDLAMAGNWRAFLWRFLMLLHGKAIGAISVGKAEAEGPFSERADRSLLATFADQAVIAIENAPVRRDAGQEPPARGGEPAQGEFLSNMSYELRTPLNAIIGVTEILPEDAETLKQYLEPRDRARPRGICRPSSTISLTSRGSRPGGWSFTSKRSR